MPHPESTFYNGHGRIHCLLIVVVVSALLLLLGVVVGVVWFLFWLFS